jgi:hypothetical protein
MDVSLLLTARRDPTRDTNARHQRATAMCGLWVRQLKPQKSRQV